VINKILFGYVKYDNVPYKIHKIYNGFQVSMASLILSDDPEIGLLKVGEYLPATQQ